MSERANERVSEGDRERVSICTTILELKVGTPVGNYWLSPVVTRESRAQEGGGIARAWIVDTKVYPSITMPNDGVHAGGDSCSYRRPFCHNFDYFVDNTCRIALLVDQMCSFGMKAGFVQLA